MIRLVEVRLVPLTLALAKTFAAKPGLPGERPLRENHVAFLNKERDEDRFMGPTWSEVLDESTGLTYRVNGQHSSTMLSRVSEDTFPRELVVAI